MSTKKVTTGNKFVDANLAELNKTDQDKQIEMLQDFVETATIDCEVQLSLLKTGELPKAQQALKKANNELTKAQKAFAKAKTTPASNFDTYVANREAAADVVEEAQEEVANAEQSIVSIEKQIALYEEILTDLS